MGKSATKLLWQKVAGSNNNNEFPIKFLETLMKIYQPLSKFVKANSFDPFPLQKLQIHSYLFYDNSSLLA